VPEVLDLSGQRHRVVVGEDQQAGGHPDPGRHARGVRKAEQRRHPDGAVETGRLQEVLGYPQRIEAELLARRANVSTCAG
jgi:hypothetical protein